MADLKALAKKLHVPMQVLVRLAMVRFLKDKKNIRWLGVK